jgi:broad specificity phosphatase PhoE
MNNIQLPDELVLLRHGQSIGNAVSGKARNGDNGGYTPEFRIMDPATWTLTELGEQQAKNAGVWMTDHNLVDFDLELSSKMIRAEQTIHLIKEGEFDFPIPWSLSVTRTHLLNERNWGALVAIPHSERMQLGLQGRFDDTFNWRPVGGETMSEVIRRIQLLMSNLHVYHQNPKRVRATCHGETMWAFQSLLERMTPERYNELYNNRSNDYRLYNCHVLHYRDLQDGMYREKYSVCAYNPKRCDSGWVKINQC